MNRTHDHSHRRLRHLLVGGGALVALSSAGALAFGAARISAEQASYSAPAAPGCVPSALNRSDALPGTSLAVSPLPDSYDASAHTQISLLGAPAADIGAISVTGSLSGHHGGSLRAYSQGDGASFAPSHPFEPDETITVRGRVRRGSHTSSFAFHFATAEQDPITYPPVAKPARDYHEMQHFHSAPSLRPPVLAVSTRSSAASPGDIFAAPYSGPGPNGPEIFSETGELIWFDPLSGETSATNLQVQQLDGRPVLTWWQGYIPPQGFGMGEEIIDNSAYRRIGTVHAGNGYKADLHDFHITARNTALLTVFNPISCNLSAVGGPAGGAVTDSVFQEIDIPTGLVRREWHSIDHVPLGDSYSNPEGSSDEWPFDYFHINSIDQLAGAAGTTLISARNTWALYELDSHTGRIGLRIGGRHSEVKQLSGAGTAFQHDATQLPDGTISIFDNGAVPKIHPTSRAIVVSLAPSAHTDTLVHDYEHSSPALSAGSQGNVQALADGNLFVGWGSQPYFSEYSPTGQVLYDAHMHGSYQSYRAYRFPWSATPAGRPSIAAGGPSGGPTTVYASWNGATEIASWRVFAGSSPSTLAPVAQAAKSGF
ncbi:MAG TPA: arylsulfotransferase family protein, partial [Solirubrobacteraceae bacterium]|nr:arylsulfotransferase family protein [Solirubrobacteraceae bacterium]